LFVEIEVLSGKTSEIVVDAVIRKFGGDICLVSQGIPVTETATNRRKIKLVLRRELPLVIRDNASYRWIGRPEIKKSEKVNRKRLIS